MSPRVAWKPVLNFQERAGLPAPFHSRPVEPIPISFVGCRVPWRISFEVRSQPSSSAETCCSSSIWGGENSTQSSSAAQEKQCRLRADLAFKACCVSPLTVIPDTEEMLSLTSRAAQQMISTIYLDEEPQRLFARRPLVNTVTWPTGARFRVWLHGALSNRPHSAAPGCKTPAISSPA